MTGLSFYAGNEVVTYNGRKYFSIYWNEKEALYDALIATPAIEGFGLSLHKNGTGKQFSFGTIFIEESGHSRKLYCLPDMSAAFGRAKEPEQREQLFAEELDVDDKLWIYGSSSNPNFHIVSYLIREWLFRENPNLTNRDLIKKQMEFERANPVPVLSFR